MTFITPKTFEVGEVLSAVDMNVFVRDNTNALNTGFRFAGRRIYSPAGSYVFAKADPFGDGSFSGFDIRLIRVIAVGGGGAGAGATATGSSEASTASGGSSGHYAESILTDIDALSDSVDVIVGAGGTGSLGTTGGNGGESRFDFLVRCAGGLGGSRSNAINGVAISPNTSGPQTPHTGQIRIPGSAGHGAIFNSPLFGLGGQLAGGMGGDGVLGTGGRGITQAQGASFGDGLGFGGGGAGVSQVSPSGVAQTGRPGADGAVIIEVYI